MEEQSTKPSAGTWDRLGSTTDQVAKVTFDVGVSQTVTFLTDSPEERDSQDNGVYYVFQVKQDDTDKVIQTSAWTLLGALKEIAPLKDKTVTITKKLDKGKQHFEVALVN